ncbi:alpha-L-fucosidase [Thermomonospora cellulosilytica]|uniref:alpha-L-fucosidase n=1 Tax=Thermomonospora cellulosilytica TaxID=1411118 RepID=A0A7W3MXY8_9ACTN|nr:alpha-L-fucosidase [Thermomonospora cellulosilytica]MBA9003980.1 alpha-L-fucosidase [Thermomonospora cellulosilytica]
MPEPFSPSRRSLLGAAAVAAGLPFPAAPPAAAGSRGRRHFLQSRIVDWRFGMFLHFNMGTFHDAEWVEPFRDPMSFTPAELDCGQWADAARAAGMRFGVLTAKHHDGFCLWPSRHTAYSVASSPVRRDVVGEYVRAFRSRGLAPCLYFSIWDRTNGVGPAGFDDRPPITRRMIDFVKAQLTELLTGYGPIPLLILDGWAWHWAFGHRTLPWPEIRAHIAALQPDCLVLDLNGLSVPWHSDLLFIEETKGGVFCPPGNTYAATQGQTIAPAGWFWHPSTPADLLTVEQIVDGHLKVLEPRYCTFILNCPPNPQGLLDDTVVRTLHEVGRRWRPDRTRPPLPPQPAAIAHPLTPAAVTATSGDPLPAIDGHSDFGWNGQADQTLWTSAAPPTVHAPQAVTLDLGRVHTGIDALTYLPRQDTRNDYVLEDFNTEGDITAYRITASTDGTSFRTVARGEWPADHTLKLAAFRPTTARYLRLEALATAGGAPAVISELDCGSRTSRPRPL